MGIESPIHLIFIGIVALLVLGPRRLPELARRLGEGMREFREAIDAGAEHHDTPSDQTADTATSAVTEATPAATTATQAADVTPPPTSAAQPADVTVVPPPSGPGEAPPQA